jgi:hypothetical protein
LIVTIYLLTAGGQIPVVSAATDKQQWLKDHAGDMTIQSGQPPAILDHGGPDEFGYYFIDSDDDAYNAPEFNWIDISEYGTNLGIIEDEQNVGPLPIGFSFNYYGEDYTEIYVCSNGWASFSSTGTFYNNLSIPRPLEPNNLLAVFWDDLHPQSNGQAYHYTNESDTCIISWHNFDRYSPEGSDYTFQIILTADGNIVYQYLSLNGVLDSHTIGIENIAGDIGLEYVYNTPEDESGKAIYFGLEGPVFAEHDVGPIEFLGPFHIGQVGNPFVPEVTFINNGISEETFNARLTIDHGGEVYNQIRTVLGLSPGATADISFPFYSPPEEGAYELTVVSELPDDEIAQNDTLRMDFTAFPSVYVEDFEDDNGFFTGNNDWQWGIPESGPDEAHSGQNVWATVLVGDYSDGPLLSTLTTRSIGLTSDPILTFWHWYETESGFDGGNVKISTDNTNWEIITPEGGYDAILSPDFENPIGGEEAFTGVSDEWQLEAFDLSAYAGSWVTFRFDFGSDISIHADGWYIDDVIVYGGGGGDPGWISGTVTDLLTGDPIEGAVVESGAGNDTTDVTGEYTIELIPGIYSVTASADFHESVTVSGIEVVEGETTVQDFALSAPGIEVDTMPIDTSMAVGSTSEYTRSITNTGNADLRFNVTVRGGDRRLRGLIDTGRGTRADDARQATDDAGNPLNESARSSFGDVPGMTLDFGDEVFSFDPETESGDSRCVGIEFDGQYFWVTGANDLVTHLLHKFDRYGNHIEAFDQGTISDWGWRDLAWDGQYLYASDEHELAIIDPTSGQKVGELPLPTSINPPLRALAWDPETDHFWSASFRSNIIEFDRTGQTLAVYANDYVVYGMAWDDVSEDGPWLWVFSQDGLPPTRISQFDPRTGTYTNVAFQVPDHGGGDDALAGGLCFTTEWEPSLGVVFGILQDTPDMIQGYEITPYSRWLIVDPVTAVLHPSESIDLNITVDFTGDDIIPDTVYEALITINNNSSETPTIPVTVTSTPETGIDDPPPDLPREFSLYQNYPNPFNSATEIKFGLPKQSHTKIQVFDLLGRRVATLVDRDLPAGYHRIIWDSNRAASGIYFYRIVAGDFVHTRQMTILK